MDPKPKIQYVGQFYVYGSEAKQVELKPKKPKTTLPRIRLDKLQKLYVDPVALGGLMAAAVMLVVLVIGSFQLHDSWQEYTRMNAYLTELKRENASLSHTYRTGFDLEEVRQVAESNGMLPFAEVGRMLVRVTVPDPEPERTAWDDFVWFLSGLFSGAKR